MRPQQIEMNLGSHLRRHGGCRRPRRMTRARWWFGQMRQAVDQAIEWPAQPNGRSEQETLVPPAL